VIPASADVNLIQNGNFAQGVGLGGTNNPGLYSGIDYDPSLIGNYGYCPACNISDWTVTPSVDWIGTYWTPPTAGYSIDLDGLEQAGSISQTVTGLTVNHTYDLSYYVNGNNDGAPLPNKDLEVYVQGGTPSSMNYTPVAGADGGPPADWVLENYVFVANLSSVTVKFQSLDNEGGLGTYPGTSFGPVIAGVSLTPEPGFYGVLAIGLIGITFALRRRRAA
jgi:hypothetical protein